MNKKGFIEVVAIFGFVFFALLGSLVYQKVSDAPDDNAVEEAAEEIIKSKTGLQVDLTPDTPEQKA